jgi:pre-mRNA-splicing factor ATP-dependent RNA helicase DHX38/PRP16
LLQVNPDFDGDDDENRVLLLALCFTQPAVAGFPLLQVNLDFDDDDENRVLLLVHDTKPPFLEGKALSGKAAGVVLPLKDPTSDMAVIARYVQRQVKTSTAPAPE